MTTKRALPKTWAPRAYAPEDDEAILAVYESAFSTWPLTKLSRPEASHIECWLPTRHPYRPLLRDLGFERSERKLRFRYTPVGLSRTELEPLRRHDTPIHLTASDTDLV